MSVKIEKAKKVKKPVDKETKISRTILLVGLLIILIPCLALGAVLISAKRDQNTPSVGSRFNGDLNPAISSSNISNIKASVEKISGVESVEVNLKTAVLRIDIDVTNSSSKGDIEKIAQSAYEAATKELKVETYFTNTTSKRMYDLNIYAFNKTNNDGGDMILYEVVKNATTQEVHKDFVPIGETKASN